MASKRVGRHYRDNQGPITALDLTIGETYFSRAARPVMEFRPNGKHTYLWIGNDDENAPPGTGGTYCFATVRGDALREFVRELVRALGPSPRERTEEGGR